MKQQIYTVPTDPSIFEGGLPPRFAYLSHAVMDEEGRGRAMHAHSEFTEVSLILRGHGWHRIGDRVYNSQPGDLLIFNTDTVHDERATDAAGVETYCVGLTDVYLKGLRPGHLAADPSQVQLPCGEQFEEIRGLLRLAEHALMENTPYVQDLTGGLAATIAALVRGLAGEGCQPPSDNSSTLVRAMRSYIDRHFAEDFTLDELASRFGVSRFYASHIFQEETGYSPIQYRQRRRIGEAQSFLTDTDYSITYIAMAVGYNNSNHFTQRFTKLVGVSPTAYRNLSIQSRLPLRKR